MLALDRSKLACSGAGVPRGEDEEPETRVDRVGEGARFGLRDDRSLGLDRVRGDADAPEANAVAGVDRDVPPRDRDVEHVAEDGVDAADRATSPLPVNRSGSSPDTGPEPFSELTTTHQHPHVVAARGEVLVEVSRDV